MSEQDDAYNLLQEAMHAAGKLGSATNEKRARELAELMAVALIKVTRDQQDKIQTATGATAVLLACASVIMQSMSQFRESHPEFSEHDVMVLASAYQIMFTQFLMQMAERLLMEVDMTGESVLGAVENMLGIHKEDTGGYDEDLDSTS